AHGATAPAFGDEDRRRRRSAAPRQRPATARARARRRSARSRRRLPPLCGGARLDAARERPSVGPCAAHVAAWVTRRHGRTAALCALGPTGGAVAARRPPPSARLLAAGRTDDERRHPVGRLPRPDARRVDRLAAALSASAATTLSRRGACT